MQELPSNTAALEPIYKALRAQNAVERSRFVDSLHSMSGMQVSLFKIHNC